MSKFSLLIPKSVVADVFAVMDLAEKYPLTIPLQVCAEFYHMHGDSMRNCIESGNSPFGFAWRDTGKANRAFKIPTSEVFFRVTKDLHPEVLRELLEEWQQAKVPSEADQKSLA